MASGSQTASSSHHSSAPRWKYDVFLSFRGETPAGRLSPLYTMNYEAEALKLSWMPQGLPETSVYFSESAKSNPRIQCMEYKSTTVIPIFYDVHPSDVRHQKGSFAKAFTRYQERFEEDDDLPFIFMLNEWRDALTTVAGLSGLESNKYSSDLDLVLDIVETLCSNLRPLDVQWAMSSTGDFVAFEATKLAMNKVMRALQDDKITAIGAFGMGGVGKTSMVKHVSAQARKLGLVHHVIMAVVSQTPNLRNIQGTLADLLGLKLLEETVFGRAVRLMDKIMKGNRILIILDDLWERIDLSSIGIAS